MASRGLNHLKLNVTDLEASVRFYSEAFGMEVIDRSPSRAILNTPGCHDTLTLGQTSDGEEPGFDHLGVFADPAVDFEALVGRIEEAGGTLEGRSTLPNGRTTAFFRDPDGFRVQI